MTTEMHYDEMMEWIKQRQGLRFGQIGTAAATLLFMYLTLGSREPMHRFIFSGAALGSAITGRVLSGRDEQISARLQDVDDISLDAWQQRLFRALRPDEARLAFADTDEPIETIPLFDWNRLSDADEHPVLGIVAPMGGGKTRLCKFLARYVLNVAHINVFDIYARVADWKGSTVLVEHAEMLEGMKNELEDIQADVAAFRDGKSNFSGVLTVVEEGADTLLELRQQNDKLTGKWLQKYTTTTRKIRRRLCVVSVKINGVDFGTGAESRDDATIIFPGVKGVAKAMKDDRVLKLGAKQNRELKEALKASLAGIKHPALVYHAGEWFPASIPELNEQGEMIGVPAMVGAIAENDDDFDDDSLTLQEQITQRKVDQIAKLESALKLDPETNHPDESVDGDVVDLSPNAAKLFEYIESKGELSTRMLQQNWAKNRKLSAQDLSELLIELIDARLVETGNWGAGVGEWVRVAKTR